MNKRVLIFSLAYYPVVGGAEVAIKEITDRISDVDFDMVTLRFDKNHKVEEKIGNVNVYRIGSSSSYVNKILFVPRATLLALKLNKEKKYDRFWAMMTYMLFPISIMRIFFGNKTPYTLTLQDGDPFSRVFNRLRIVIFSPLLRYGFKNASSIQAISNFLADWARKMGFKGELIVVPNGVDISAFSKHFESEELLGAKKAIGVNDGEVVLVTTSRLSHKNGIDIVIKALPQLPSNYIFAVIGTGEEEKKLKLFAQKIGVENRVKFLGFIPHERVIPYLKISNIFIRTSRSEGMGNSFVEAMAAGLPIIGTPVGGIVDFLKDNETGFMCESENPKSVADTVQKVINLSQDQKSKIIITAQNLAKEKYNWDLIAKDMGNILNK